MYLLTLKFLELTYFLTITDWTGPWPGFGDRCFKS